MIRHSIGSTECYYYKNSAQVFSIWIIVSFLRSEIEKYFGLFFDNTTIWMKFQKNIFVLKRIKFDMHLDIITIIAIKKLYKYNENIQPNYC